MESFPPLCGQFFPLKREQTQIFLDNFCTGCEYDFLLPSMHKPADDKLNIIWLKHTIFSEPFYDVHQIYAHLLNKWKPKKESCGGWLFWGAVIAFPALQCLRCVICREIEMKLAGRAATRTWFTHIVKSHGQPAAAAVHQPTPDTDLSLRRISSKNPNLMESITHRTQLRVPTPACRWQCWMPRNSGQ